MRDEAGPAGAAEGQRVRKRRSPSIGKGIVAMGRGVALNDILRRSLSGETLVLTADIVALGRERQQIILDAIAACD